MRVANDAAWLEIADAFGPRIMGYGRTGESNVLASSAAFRDTPQGRWHAFGGHRCWIAPERFPETYRVDNDPPRIERLGDASVVVSDAADADPLVRELQIELHSDGAATVVHRVRNRGTTPVTAALWGLSIMRPGGTAVLERGPRRTHPEALAPSETLVLWPYARLDDPRVRLTADTIEVRPLPAFADAWKIGIGGATGRCAYVLPDVTFVVETHVSDVVTYPDRGSAFEVFVQGDFIELETLGPLQTCAPGATLEHTERWSLREGSEHLRMAVEETQLPDRRAIAFYTFDDV